MNNLKNNIYNALQLFKLSYFGSSKLKTSFLSNLHVYHLCSSLDSCNFMTSAINSNIEDSNGDMNTWQMNIPYNSEPNSKFKSDFIPKYHGKCQCGRIEIECNCDPLDVKICHCKLCQKLHGCPMQTAVIFHKHSIRFTKGIKHLNFYNSEVNKNEHILPCKVSCNFCHSLIADEGRNMFIAFPSIFDFEDGIVPQSFKPKCHIFYGQRQFDMYDELPKWIAHKQKSQLFHAQNV